MAQGFEIRIPETGDNRVGTAILRREADGGCVPVSGGVAVMLSPNGHHPNLPSRAASLRQDTESDLRGVCTNKTSIAIEKRYASRSVDRDAHAPGVRHTGTKPSQIICPHARVVSANQE
jgi:hypothetical protein